jgi:hypothetical protein
MTNKATISTKENETITQLIFDTNDGLCNANGTFTLQGTSGVKVLQNYIEEFFY